MLRADSFYNLSHKRVNEQLARFLSAYTPLLHIEKRRLVELAGTGSVRRFDVSGIDLQLGLGAHLCCLRENEISVRLMSLRLLCVRNNLQVADEMSAGTVVVSRVPRDIAAERIPPMLLILSLIYIVGRAY